MALLDRYGLPLSTAFASAADSYVKAVDHFLAAGDNLTAGFEAALAIDPGFALAEIGRARCLATYGRGTEARTAAARARDLTAGISAREKAHVEALALAIEARGAEALAAIKVHLSEFPRDALVLQPATGIFGLVGFSGRLERESELLTLLDGLAPHYGDDWWFTANRAFAECEAGRVGDAEARVEQALEAAPHNANAAHVRAHVHYEFDQGRAGAAFLRGWLKQHTTRGILRGHLCWHLALWELGGGNAAEAWLLYEQELRPALVGEGAPIPPLNVLTDVASWLWRAELHGQPRRDADWLAVAGYCAERFAQAGVAFADIHVAMATLRCGDAAAFERLRADLERLGGERPASAIAARIAAGFAASTRGDWALAAAHLGEARVEAVRVGGSRAQRELVDRSLLQAFGQAGLAEQAAALRAQRPQIAAGA